MKFNILSIDDSREHYKKAIRAVVKCDEVSIPTFNGHVSDVAQGLVERGLAYTNQWQPFTLGEMGVWLSTFDCWAWCVQNNEHLLVFEDDAVPAQDFDLQLDGLQIPSDFGYVALWVPENQHVDYQYSITYEKDGMPIIHGMLPPGTSHYNLIPNREKVCRAYQGYGNVATLYSPQGGSDLIKEARKLGLYMPIDCFIHTTSHVKRVNGLAPKPDYATLVGYDWPETTVHLGAQYL